MPAAKWKDILTDSKLYPDDFTVSMKDGQTMTLGDMRSYDKEHEGELTKTLTAREQKLQEREQALSSATVNFGTVVEKVAERSGLTVEELLAGKQPTRKEVAKAAELDENDPLVGTLVKEIKGLRSELSATKEEISNVKKSALGPMLNTYLDDYYENTWDSKVAPTLPKSSKVTREQALEYAQKHSMKDAKGRLDLSKAARELTFDDRVNAEAEKRVADLRKKDEEQRTLAAIPKPGGTHLNVKTDKSLLDAKGHTKSFDEMLNEAAQDTEMWQQIQRGQA